MESRASAFRTLKLRKHAFGYVESCSVFGADLIQLMNGRWFEKQQVEAFIATGKEKFKKSNEKQVGLFDDEDDGEGEGGRLDKFGSWLEEEKAK